MRRSPASPFVFVAFSNESPRAYRVEDEGSGPGAELRIPGRVHRAPALAYQRQVELIMNAPRQDARRGDARRERLAAAAVLLAIAVSICGACVVIVESSSEAPRAQAGAPTPGGVTRP
jgi:hypothetical protein